MVWVADTAGTLGAGAGRLDLLVRASGLAIRASSSLAVPVAVIDGPYDAGALSGILSKDPVALGDGGCSVDPNSACSHGTFVMGLLGARHDAPMPGLCPDCELLHIPLFVDESAPSASVVDLAYAIAVAVRAGARLINLSLAILGDDAENHRDLAAALDLAEKRGAVLVVAAGNQGRVAMGQLLSRPVTIPVVAVDAAGQLLPDCNFGPAISRRGVATLGQAVPGYAPGGGTTTMSGTSAATAVATGALARVWSARPDADGAAIRAAVARLAPRNGPVPPLLDPNQVLAELDRSDAAAVTAERRSNNYARLQGGATMSFGNSFERGTAMNVAARTPGQVSRGGDRPGQAVTPACGPGGCTCGAPGGICDCGGGESAGQFVYVWGDVDIRFPDPSILVELESIALTLQITPEPNPNQSLRDWYLQVLRSPEARYIARQVCWILKVQGQPAYYLCVRTTEDLADLIKCLALTEGNGKAYYDQQAVFVGTSSLIPVETSPGVSVPVLVVDQLFQFSLDAMFCYVIGNVAKEARAKQKAAEANKDEDEAKEWKKRADEFEKETDDAKKALADKKKINTPHKKQLDEIFYILGQSSDNFGDTDEHRAINYLAVRYAPIYENYLLATLKYPLEHDEKLKNVIDRPYYLAGVTAARSRLSREAAGKRIVQVVLIYRNQVNAVDQKWFVRVDVSHLFPMIVTHYQPYVDRYDPYVNPYPYGNASDPYISR